VSAEPLRESSHRALIAAYLAEGNVQCALRQFGLFRALLDREVGLVPSEQMNALLEVVKANSSAARRSLG
jgi:DNA-binding SARP family transcriptional activator